MNKYLKRIWTLNTGHVVVAGRFATGGAGALGAVTGSGFTVVKSGTGEYTITLETQMRTPTLLSAVCGIHDGTIVNGAQFISANPSTGVFILNTFVNDGTPAAADIADLDAVDFVLHLKNSGLTSP